MIEEQFVSFDTAKLMKEAGFGVPTRGTWRQNYTGDAAFVEHFYGQTADDISRHSADGFQHEYLAPTQALAARWLREVHKLHVYALQTNLPYTEPQITKWEWGYVIDKIDDPNSNVATCEMYFGSYEAALEAGLQEAIKLIKK